MSSAKQTARHSTASSENAAEDSSATTASNVKRKAPKNQYFKTKAGLLDKETTRLHFMNSDATNWKEYCVIVGWNYRASMSKFPVRIWTKEKQQQILLGHRETVQDMLFKHQSTVNQKIMSTLIKSPDLAFFGEKLVWMKMKEIDELKVELQNYPKPGPRSTKEHILDYKTKVAHFNDISSPKNIQALNSALEIAQRTIRASLLMTNWNIQRAEDFANPPVNEETKQSDSNRRLFQIGGMEPITSEQLRTVIRNMYDEPLGDGDPADMPNKFSQMPVVQGPIEDINVEDTEDDG